jgi:hypothetical protein
MILPTKGISQDRALLSMGAELLSLLNKPMGVSALWDKSKKNFQKAEKMNGESISLTFDIFSLSLAVLFSVGVVDFDGNMNLRRRHVSA